MRMMNLSDKAKPVAVQPGRTLVMRELMTDDAKDRIHLPRLLGPWGIEVDRDHFTPEFGVSQRIRTELAPPPHAAPERAE